MRIDNYPVVADRDSRGRWLKGTSGNSLGRPRSALAEMCRRQITKHGLVTVLGAIAARKGRYRQCEIGDQIRAIQLLLLHGYGVPKTEIEAGDVRIQVTYDQRNQIAIAGSASLPGPNHP